MKKFEKTREWFKENKNEIICGAIIAGTAIGAFWLGKKLTKLEVEAGLLNAIYGDGTIAFNETS